MLVGEYIKKTGIKTVVLGADREIKSAYAGDFLSVVMSSAQMGSIWFTVMNNVNVAGVACLTDCACVVLCQCSLPDKSLTEKCKIQGINLLCTEKPVYEACTEFFSL